MKTISIQFGAYQRPGQILYSKSTDGGLTYSPWHRYVTFPYECSSIFGVTYADRPFLANSVLCRTFLPLLAPTKGNESVSHTSIISSEFLYFLEEERKMVFIVN